MSEVRRFQDELQAGQEFERILDEIVSAHPDPRRLQLETYRYEGRGKGSQIPGGVRVVWDVGGPLLVCTFIRDPLNWTVMTVVRPAPKSQEPIRLSQWLGQ